MPLTDRMLRPLCKLPRSTDARNCPWFRLIVFLGCCVDLSMFLAVAGRVREAIVLAILAVIVTVVMGVVIGHRVPPEDVPPL